MKFKVTESKFGVPAGIYRTKFVGCQLRTPQPGQSPLLGRDGQPMPPGMEWQFEVLDGDYAGKITSRTTGQDASPKNACGRMIADVTGVPVRIGIEVDIDQYVGRIYQVRVGQNPNSDGTRVETVMPVGNTAPPPAGANGTGAGGMASADQTAEIKRLFAEVFPEGASPADRAALLAAAGVPTNVQKMTAPQADALLRTLAERCNELAATTPASDYDDGNNGSEIPF